jgi:membrane protease YdiL (CAAX protease family)
MWTAPPGWYPDPYRAAQHRWWDGSNWTQSIAGVASAPGWGPRPVPAPHPTLALQAAIGAVLAVALPVFASRLVLRSLFDHGWPIGVYLTISAVLGYGPALLWCRYASRRWGSGSLRADAGVSARWVDAGWGPVAWLACLATQLVVGIVVTLGRIPTAGNTDGIGERRDDRAFVIAVLVLAVVVAPIVEEIIFRGFVLRGLLSCMSVVPAVAIQAVLFGASHVDPARGMGNIGLVLILSGVGATLGGAAYLTRRLAPSMIAHAIGNAVAMALVLSGVLDRLQ